MDKLILKRSLYNRLNGRQGTNMKNAMSCNWKSTDWGQKIWIWYRLRIKWLCKMNFMRDKALWVGCNKKLRGELKLLDLVILLHLLCRNSRKGAVREKKRRRKKKRKKRKKRRKRRKRRKRKKRVKRRRKEKKRKILNLKAPQKVDNLNHDSK